jgi:hypothetical protein
MGIYLTGMHLMGVYPTGVYLMSVRLTGVCLIGIYLASIHLTGVCLMGMHLAGMHPMGVHLMARTSWACREAPERGKSGPATARLCLAAIQGSVGLARQARQCAR